MWCGVWCGVVRRSSSFVAVREGGMVPERPIPRAETSSSVPGEEEGGRDGARDAGLPDLELRAQGEAAAHRECQVCHGGRPLIVEV